MAMREQAEQQEYRNYRNKLNEAYLAEKFDTLFIFYNERWRKSKCDHYLEQIKGKNEQYYHKKF